MKVAFFLGALNQGGMESLMLNICKHKDSAPFDFIVIYRKDGTLSAAFAETGVKMVKIPKKSLPRYILDIRKTVKAEKLDVVHSQTPSNTMVLAFALLGMHSVRVVTTFHGFSFAGSSWLSRKIVYHKSDRIICVSEYERQYYRDKWRIQGIGKFSVVYNGIDFDRLDAGVASDLNLPAATSGPKLAMVGSFMSGRDQLCLVKALAELKRSGTDDFDFYFIGRKIDSEPERYDDCVEICRKENLNNVHFLGGRSDVPAILHHIDGFVYCTEHDTFGMAVIEAMGVGLPVVVNDWVVMKEVCSLECEEDSVMLFDSGSVKACAEAIKALMDDIDSYKFHALELVPKVREKYSIDEHIKGIGDIYCQKIKK